MMSEMLLSAPVAAILLSAPIATLLIPSLKEVHPSYVISLVHIVLYCFWTPVHMDVKMMFLYSFFTLSLITVFSPQISLHMVYCLQLALSKYQHVVKRHTTWQVNLVVSAVFRLEWTAHIIQKADVQVFIICVDFGTINYSNNII